MLREFCPDLIIAVGGGSVLDYAKIANVVINDDILEKSIINSNFPFKKKYSSVEEFVRKKNIKEIVNFLNIIKRN